MSMGTLARQLMTEKEQNKMKIYMYDFKPYLFNFHV